jgi:hypothetical protein
MRWLAVLVVLFGSTVAEAQERLEPTPYDRARECSLAGDNVCVVRELVAPTVAREYELLIAALRAVGGHDADVDRRMREYLAQFPTGRMAAQYRQFLIAHGAL